ncbi:hypothetical protein ACFSHQ_19775 [Gemmobacter lanyuensis]
MRVIVALLMCLGLAACQMTLPGLGGKSAIPPAQAPAAPAGVTAKPGTILGSAVAVTPIRPGTPAAPPAAQTAAVPKAVTPLPAATPAAASSPVAAPVVAPAAPPTPKSEAQLACEKQKGRWTQAGVNAWLVSFRPAMVANPAARKPIVTDCALPGPVPAPRSSRFSAATQFYRPMAVR